MSAASQAGVVVADAEDLVVLAKFLCADFDSAKALADEIWRLDPERTIRIIDLRVRW